MSPVPAQERPPASPVDWLRRLQWRSWLARFEHWPAWRLFLGALLLGLLVSLPWQCVRYFKAGKHATADLAVVPSAAPGADAPMASPGSAASILGMPAAGAARALAEPTSEFSDSQEAELSGQAEEQALPATVLPGEISAAEAVFSPPPVYPRSALRSGDEGTVRVRVSIDSNGVPFGLDIEQSSRSRLLDRAAIDALRHWRFKPAFAQGTAVESSLVIPITFTAQREN